jgi:PKD repeat protein
MNKYLFLLFFPIVCSCHKEQTIPVEIDVTLHIMDDNHTSPLWVTIENKTQGANTYQWTFEGGEPLSSIQKNPGTVRFIAPGEHSVVLEAWNEGSHASKSYTIRVDSAVSVDFSVEVDINNYAPASFLITNLSSGGTSYSWTFEGGSPALYEGISPPVVTYGKEGKYTISLTAENGSATFETHKEIEVSPSLDASFSIIPSFEDEDDMEAPLRATFDTWLQGVESLIWKCEGTEISHPTSADANILFPSPGKYTVYLEVSNGKETKQVSQNITVNVNTNLRAHKDIQLGINTAQEGFSVYYSTKLRRSFKVSEINEDNGSFVDIAYFGLSQHFTYNLFVSPARLSETTFPEIPNARHTRFINKMESGTITITQAQFDSMQTDSLLRNLPIASTMYGDEFFTHTPLPRVVLFETPDRRKGAILVKEMISNEKENSYIIIDIKVQKND